MRAGIVSAKRGPRRERAVAELLRDDRWEVVRAAGSHGPYDLMCLHVGETPLLVQVKSDARGPFAHFPPAERMALLAAAHRAGARAVLCWWPPDRRTVPTWLYPEDWPTMVAA